MELHKLVLPSIVLTLSLSYWEVNCMRIAADNIEIIEELLNQKADNKTLVVLDCDEVLLTPIDPILAPKNVEKMYHPLLEYLMKHMSSQEAAALIFEIRKQMKLRILNKKWPEIIKNLQDKGIKVVVLTAQWTGEYFGVIQENLRKEELRIFNLERSWPKSDRIVFNDFPAVSGIYTSPRYPIFEEGIICSCNVDKGTVLKAFLKHFPDQFTNIIFVDDKQKNVDSVMTACKNSGLSCTGIVYTEGEKLRSMDPEITFEEIIPKIDKFVETRVW